MGGHYCCYNFSPGYNIIALILPMSTNVIRALYLLVKYTIRGILDMAIQYDELGNVIQGSGLLDIDAGNIGQSMNQQAAARLKRQGAIAFGEREVPGVEEGAEVETFLPTEVYYSDATTVPSPSVTDTRVKIRVPPKYLVQATSGFFNNSSPLIDLGGIIFPYTPSISYEAKAEYATQSPLHSNFAINFYQRSSISPITISGKFSVENAKDAAVYIATKHLLMALTRMRSGGAAAGDSDSGAPPPICRLDAYGEMLRNVPIAITSVRIELPDSVDYFVTDNGFGLHSVPTMSTIAVTCLPMYSRDEMQKFSVSKYLNKGYDNKGYI